MQNRTRYLLLHELSRTQAQFSARVMTKRTKVLCTPFLKTTNHLFVMRALFLPWLPPSSSIQGSSITICQKVFPRNWFSLSAPTQFHQSSRINLWTRVGLGVLFEGDVFASEAADQKNWRLRLSAQEYKIVWNFSTLVRADFEWIESSNLQFILRVAKCHGYSFYFLYLAISDLAILQQRREINIWLMLPVWELPYIGLQAAGEREADCQNSTGIQIMQQHLLSCFCQMALSAEWKWSSRCRELLLIPLGKLPF